MKTLILNTLLLPSLLISASSMAASISVVNHYIHPIVVSYSNQIHNRLIPDVNRYVRPGGTERVDFDIADLHKMHDGEYVNVYKNADKRAITGIYNDVTATSNNTLTFTNRLISHPNAFNFYWDSSHKHLTYTVCSSIYYTIHGSC